MYKSRTESWNDQPMWSFSSGLCCYPAARSRPSTACAEEAHASVVGSAFVAPRCSRRRSPGLLLAPLLLSSSAVEYIEAHCCLRRRHPCVHCAEDAHASIVLQHCQGHLLLAHFPSSFRRRLPRYHITGPASLAEQISPEHGCSLSPLVQRLVPFLTLSTLDVGYKEAACGR